MQMVSGSGAMILESHGKNSRKGDFVLRQGMPGFMRPLILYENEKYVQLF